MKESIFRKKLYKYLQSHSIQRITAISFSVVSFICIAFMSVLLYVLFINRMTESTIADTEQLLNQTATNLETYLRNMRMVSDTAYYDAIKEADLAVDVPEDSMNLLYEANKDNLISIACYYNDGSLVACVPTANLKSDIDVKGQDWFASAMREMENVQFSLPHVQNVFNNTSSYHYYWVVSLSRAVELNRNGHTTLGVLVIDMNYSSIEQLFNRVNDNKTSGYVYLTDSNGKIIYHPRQSLIFSNLMQENNLVHSGHKDGSYIEKFNDKTNIVSVQTVSYTGWKIISVQPYASSISISETRNFAIMIIVLGILTMLLLSRLVARFITSPLHKLTESIRMREDGTLNPDIYIGGNYDVKYLGQTLKDTVEQLRLATDAVVKEQEEKRKSELDALQSQINPHFLYNALDTIVWMIEGEAYEDAVFMVTQLASLFRISLSKGKTIIPISDEITHAKNYMNIQKVRYKDKFTCDFDIDPEVMDGFIVKLVLQPILENAIYYGMESMDGDGEISVKGRRVGDDVYLTVKDNGLGMSKEIVDNLLTSRDRVNARGSGVGLINVHNRIKLRFGQEYGLSIESEPDMGTSVTVHIPYFTSRGGDGNEK